MMIIGCDYHPGFQQIAGVDTETGEVVERRLTHREEAEQFYQDLKQRNATVRLGMESSGHGRWFERLLGYLGLSCGSEMRLRFAPSGYASRRRIVRMRSCCYG
jgi:hypothetical protein